MADLVLATIDPSGSGDYTTLAACEAGEQRDWVAADEFGVWEAQGDWSGGADTSSTAIDGQVTDADHDITIRTDAANRHAGIWDTGKYIAQSISAVNDWVNFIGLQIGATSQGTVSVRARGDFIFESCIFRNNAGTRASLSLERSANATVANCLFEGDAGNEEGIEVAFDADTVEVLNCTFYDCFRGIRNVGATVTAYNCLSDASADVDFAGTIGGSNNASGDGTAPGANSITNGTFVFEDQPNGDFRIAAADTSGVKTGGTDLSAHSYPVTVDIAGTPRSATPTIGAFEFASSGPDVTVDGDADVTSPTASGSAGISVSASGAALVVAPVGSGSVSSSLEANGSALVVPPVASSSVESSLEVTGAALVITPSGSGTVEMSVDVSGTPAVTVPTASGFVTVDGSGADVTVTGDADVVSPTASGSGSVSVSASGAALVLPPGANGSVKASLEVSGASVVVPPTASGEVSPGVHVSGAGSVLPLLGSSTGVTTVPVSGSPSVVPLTASGSVSFSMSLSGASTVSPLSASGFVFVGNVLPGAYTSIPILSLTYDPIRVDFLDSYSIDLELE